METQDVIKTIKDLLELLKNENLPAVFRKEVIRQITKFVDML